MGCRGFVSNQHPSEVMPLQWPDAGPTFVLQPGAVQLGVSMEPLGQHTNHAGCDDKGTQLLEASMKHILFQPVAAN